MAPGRDIAGSLVGTLVRILRRIIRRGNLSILCIGWRAGRTPVTLLARGRSLLGGRAACCCATKAGASTRLAPNAPESSHGKRFVPIKFISL